jgi:hypothetical protein
LAFHLANRRPQLLLLLGLLGLCGLGTAGLADGSTKPAMTIIMERGELLENQTTSLTVWIENPTDARMTDIHFSYAGPKFLQIGTFAPDNKTCAVVSKDIDFGAIEPGSALQPPRRLCLQAGSPIDERDESLGFSVAYTLVKDGKATSGFVVAEKKLSVGLFGTESIGGVSLRLAAYVIPGLLFMMILRLGGFPWSEQLGGTEVATLSVLVSVFLFVVAGFIPHIPFAFTGIGSSVSTDSFLTLCAMAVAVSLVMVLIYRALKACAERRRKALLVDVVDNDATVFRKALRGATADLRPVTVVTRNQERFVGSLMAPTSSGGVALVGWFELRLAEADPRRQQFEPLIAGNRLSEALDLADQQQPAIVPQLRNAVRTLADDGTLATTGNNVRRFLRRDVLESAPGDVPELEDQKPLMLGTP